jgi:hypothetical protein
MTGGSDLAREPASAGWEIKAAVPIAMTAAAMMEQMAIAPVKTPRSRTLLCI